MEPRAEPAPAKLARSEPTRSEPVECGSDPTFDELPAAAATVALPVYGTRKSSRRLQQQHGGPATGSSDADTAPAHFGGVHSQESAGQLHAASGSEQSESAPPQVSSSLGSSGVSSASALASSTGQTLAAIVHAGPTFGPSEPSAPSTGVGSLVGSGSTISTTKQQRKWEMWQADDTRWFFEALSEHGKDFHSIHQYMSVKLKKKEKRATETEEQMKNKEQIRCYFNRQWNKLAALLDLRNHRLKEVEKTAQQLYAMINYGEIWKRFNFKNDLKLDSKLKNHLNDMICKGYTFMKVGKGKNFKLKTPPCKALKRLHHLEDSHPDGQQLPKDVLVELQPASNYAWLRVQSVSHNPALRVRCPLQKRLSSLISFLEQRWTDVKRRNLLCLQHSGRPLEDDCAGSTASAGDQGGQSAETDSPSGKDVDSPQRKLRLRPHPSFTKNLNSIRIVRLQGHQMSAQLDLSLDAYLARVSSQASLPENKKKRNPPHLAGHQPCSKRPNRDEPSEKDHGRADDRTPSTDPQRIDTKDVVELLPDTTDRANVSPIIETVRSLNLLNNIVSSSADAASSTEKATEPDSQASTSRLCGEVPTNCRTPPLAKRRAVNLQDPPPNATIGEWLSANLNSDSTSEEKFARKRNKLWTQVGEIDASPPPKVRTDETANSGETPAQQMQRSSQLVGNGLPNASPTEQTAIDELCRTVDPQLVRHGWTAENTDELSLGELCLMLKCRNKIVLQYDWEFPQEPCKTPTSTRSVLSRFLATASIALMQLQKEKEKENVLSSPAKSCKNSGAGVRKNKRIKPLELFPVQPQAARQLDLDVPSEDQRPAGTSSTELGSPETARTLLQTPDAEPAAPANFAVPSSPAPRPSAKHAKNRIVNEALLQEAKEQLNGKFTTRRAGRKPVMKPQQFHLNLNANQILGNNWRQLLSNQTNPALASATAGNQALLSVIAAAASGSGSQPANPFIAGNTVIRQLPTRPSRKANAEQTAPSKSSPEGASMTGADLARSGQQVAPIAGEDLLSRAAASCLGDELCTPGSTDDVGAGLQVETIDGCEYQGPLSFGQPLSPSTGFEATELPVFEAGSAFSGSPNELLSDTPLDSTDTSFSSSIAPAPTELIGSSSNVCSPPSLSSLLDMSLGDSGSLFADSADRYFFSSMLNSSGSRNTPLSTPTKVQIEQQLCSTNGNGAFPISFNKLTEQFQQAAGDFSAGRTARNGSSSTTEAMAGLPTARPTGLPTQPSATSCSSGPADQPSGAPSWLHALGSELTLNNLFDCPSEPPVENRNFTAAAGDAFCNPTKKPDQLYAVLDSSGHAVEPNETLSMSTLIGENSMDLISKFVDFTEKLSE